MTQPSILIMFVSVVICDPDPCYQPEPGAHAGGVCDIHDDGSTYCRCYEGWTGEICDESEYEDNLKVHV